MTSRERSLSVQAVKEPAFIAKLYVVDVVVTHVVVVKYRFVISRQRDCNKRLQQEIAPEIAARA